MIMPLKIRLRDATGRWPTPKMERPQKMVATSPPVSLRRPKKKRRTVPNTRRGKAGGMARSTRGRRGIIQRKPFHGA